MIQRLVLGFLLLGSLGFAQTYQPILQPHQHFVDASGDPCAGCSLYSYQAGTTTPLATYTDSTGATPNTNPIILDASGAANIWLGASSYKFALLATDGTTLWTVDNVSALSLDFLPLSGGTLTGPLTAPYYQFTTNPNACTSGEYVSGWTSTGWTCSIPAIGGTAGGDLSGTYPNPTVAQIEGAAIPISAPLLGTNGSGQLIPQTGTIANSTTGNAATATQFAATPSACPSGQYASAISANGTPTCSTPGGTAAVVQSTHLGSASCSPPGSSYSTCTNVLTWPAAFANTNYYATCSLVAPIGGGGGSNSLLVSVDGPTSASPPTTTTITVVVTNNTSDSGTTAADIYCTGVHN